MDKLNYLLKKIEVFEKIALYGNRKEFLKKIVAEDQGILPPIDFTKQPNVMPSLTRDILSQINKLKEMNPKIDLKKMEEIIDNIKNNLLPNIDIGDKVRILSLINEQENILKPYLWEKLPVSTSNSKPKPSIIDNINFYISKLNGMMATTDSTAMWKILTYVNTKLMPIVYKTNATAYNDLKQKLDAIQGRIEDITKKSFYNRKDFLISESTPA